jgi:uncharacterized membrane protein HdeD (DUF308 family)
LISVGVAVLVVGVVSVIALKKKRRIKRWKGCLRVY